MKGLVGALCWCRAWGPGPLAPPLNPALCSMLNCRRGNITLRTDVLHAVMGKIESRFNLSRDFQRSDLEFR